MGMRTALAALPFLLFFFPLSVSAHARISEVLWMGSDVSASDEWVEIACVNHGTESGCALGGWTLTSLNSSGQEKTIVTFGTGSTMESGALLLVSRFDADVSRLAVTPDIVTTAMSLPNTKLLLRLRNGSGQVMDQADDGVGNPVMGSNGTTKASMERIDLSATGSLMSSWRTATQSVGFDAGPLIAGSPGAPNDPPPPAADPIDLRASVTDGYLSMSWTPAHDLARQILTITPALADGTDRWILPASLGTWTVQLDEGQEFDLLLRAIGKIGDESEGMQIHVEPYLKSNSSSSISNQESASASSAESSQAVSSESASASEASQDSSSSVSSYSFSQDSFTSSSSAALISSAFPESSESSSALYEEKSSASFSSVWSSRVSSISVSVSSATLRMTEVMADPPGNEDEWIEITVAGSGSVDLAGWSLHVGSSAYPLTKVLTGSMLSGQHIVLFGTPLGFRLTNAGADLSLWRDDEKIDQLLYSNARDGISIGRLGESTGISFCTPTRGQPNFVIQPAVGIHLQSGTASGEAPLSLNVEARATPAFSGDRCVFDFGDGSAAVLSCNPGNHAYSSAGAYTLRLTYTDSCSTTVTQELPITVVAAASASSATAAGGGGTTASKTASSAPSACTPTAMSGISIHAFLPDPAGKDEETEWIELRNDTAKSIDLCGWSLDDEDGGSKPHRLDGHSITASSVLRLMRPDTGIALNNDTDSVRLLRPNGSIEQAEYGKAPSGTIFVRQSDGSFAPQATTSQSSSAAPGEYETKTGEIISIDEAAVLGLRLEDGSIIAATWQHVLCPDTSVLSAFRIEDKNMFMKSIRDVMENKKFDLQMYSKNTKDFAVRILKNGRDIAEKIIENGFCVAGNDAPPAYFQEEAKARRNKHGLWSMKTAHRIVSRLRTVAADSFTANIFISEIVPTGGEEWVELFNAGDESVQLHDWRIDDAEGTGSKPHLLSSGAVIGAKQFLVLTGKHLSISLNDGGDAVRLLRPDDSVADAVSYPKLKEGQSVARVDDAWCVTDAPTPGLRNTCATEAALTPSVLGETTVIAKPVVVKKTAASSSKKKASSAAKKKTTTAKSTAKTSAKQQTLTGSYAALLGIVGERGGAAVSGVKLEWIWGLAILLAIAGYVGWWTWQKWLKR